MSALMRLTAMLGERDRDDGTFVADHLIDTYERLGIRASILLRGAVGYGPAHRLRSDRLLSVSEDLPLVVIAIDERRRIERAAAETRATMRRGVILVEGTGGEDATGSESPDAKLTILCGRHERVDGRDAYLAVCELLRAAGVAGATVLLGVDGTLHGARERARFLGANARVPLMIVAVGRRTHIAATLPKLRALLEDPILTIEPVQVCKRDGVLLNELEPPAAALPSDLPHLQRLTIYTSESAHHGPRPIHAEAIRRLRASGAHGATALRGIWGFHGDHEPHGDRLLQLRRRVPMVTTTVDHPERIAQSFALIDELTTDTGLVTIEPINNQTLPSP